MFELFEEHPKGCISAIIGAIAVVLIIITISSSYKRIDPGNAGILVNYAAASSAGKPVVTPLSTGQYVFIAPFSGSQLVEYPIAQQQLVLSSRENEGELQGDSTIACQMSGGGVLKVGLTVNWAVNAEHPEILYLKKPGVPLTSSLNQDINTTLVYGFVRSDLLDLCTQYTWQDILGDGTRPTQVDAMRAKLLTNLRSDLAQDGIAVSQVSFNERNPDSTIQAVLNARNDAQKSAYLKQQAQYQADAEIAKANGDAQSIAIINAQLAKSPNYINYLIAQKWDGKLPSYLATNGQSNPVVAPFNK